MRRVVRALLAACTAAWLVLFLAVCVLWGRSYWRTFHAIRSSIERTSVLRFDHFFIARGSVGWNDRLWVTDSYSWRELDLSH